MSDPTQPVAFDCTAANHSQRFRFDSGELTLDIVETFFAIRELWESLPKEGATHKDYMDNVVEWVKKTHALEIKIGEADLLEAKVGELYTRKKKEQREAIESVWKLPSSTDSTPSS